MADNNHVLQLTAAQLDETLRKVPELEETVGRLSGEKLDAPIVVESNTYTKGTSDFGGYIDTNGAQQSAGAWKATGYLELKGTVHISGIFVNYPSISAVAFYDENKNFMSSVHTDEQNDFNFSVDMDAPAGAKFVRFTFIAESNDHQYATITDTHGDTYAFERDAVLYRTQDPTEEQQATARANINAAERITEEVSDAMSVDRLTIGALISPSDGSIVHTGSFKCSDFILLPDKAVITGSCYEFTGTLSIAYYDKNRNFISGVGGVNNWDVLTGPFEVPENAVYVRFSMNSAHTSFNLTVNGEREVKDFIFDKMLDYNTIVAEAYGNAYINSNGVAESTAAWSVSDYIRVNNSYSIDYCLYGTASTAQIAFYDMDQNFVSGITGTETKLYTATNVIPPDNAYYMRYAVLNGQTTQYVNIRYKKIQRLEVEAGRMLDENPLRGKILSATGDSITATVSYRQYASYARMIAAKNNMTYETEAIWGATIAEGIEGSSGCILTTLSSMRDDADYIILSGGANDFYALSSGREQLGAISTGYSATLDTTTFCGALESMCKTAIERWPGKKILYVITHRMLDVGHADLQSWVAKLIEILEKWGIPYVDLWHDMPSLALPTLKNLYTSMGNTEYNGTGDGLHPNEEGYRLYYVPRVEAKMKSI